MSVSRACANLIVIAVNQYERLPAHQREIVRQLAQVAEAGEKSREESKILASGEALDKIAKIFELDNERWG